MVTENPPVKGGPHRRGNVHEKYHADKKGSPKGTERSIAFGIENPPIKVGPARDRELFLLKSQVVAKALPCDPGSNPEMFN